MRTESGFEVGSRAVRLNVSKSCILEHFEHGCDTRLIFDLRHLARPIGRLIFILADLRSSARDLQKIRNVLIKKYARYI
jgi:hypothetical protein